LADRFRRKYWALKADEHDVAYRNFHNTDVLRRLRFSSVIVPLDGSRYAEHAIPLAAEVAAAAKVPIRLESGDLLLAEGDDHWTPPIEDVARPARRLCETAKENDLVVIAQRARHFSNPFAPGHSIERLLRCGSSPIIVVRGYRWPFEKRTSRPIKHILVVLDGSSKAERVLPAALAIAEATESQVTLLRIVPGMPDYGIPWAEKELEAKTYLENVRQVALDRRIRVEPAVWSSDEPLGQVILSFAENHNADLIAITTSRRRTLVGTFRRQPVRYLVRKSWIPLLICGSEALTSNA
jgi:nucleotide-binding universal stress UspA family protein